MISVVLFVLLPLISAIPVIPEQKKCTESCLSSYTNEIENAPLIYDYQNETEIDQNQLCNYAKKMVFCNALCPNEIMDENKSSVARNFALAYLCKKHENSLPEILNIIGQLPINAYNKCSETCLKIQDSCEKQTCYKNCLKENYAVCDKETPCMNLITAEVFIHNFPFESSSKDSDELKQQTDSHMEHIPEPSKCLTNLISNTANIEREKSDNDEMEASGMVESIEPHMEEGSEVATGEPDVSELLQRIKSITLHLRPLQKKNEEMIKMESVDRSTESQTADEPEISTNTEASMPAAIPAESIAVPTSEFTTVATSLQVDAMETSVSAESSTESAVIDSSVPAESSSTESSVSSESASTDSSASDETAATDLSASAESASTENSLIDVSTSTESIIDDFEASTASPLMNSSASTGMPISTDGAKDASQTSDILVTEVPMGTSTDSSLDFGSGLEPEMESTATDDDIAIESVEEANRLNNIQADSAIQNSETSMDGQKEVVPTEITAERTDEMETTTNSEEVGGSTEISMTAEGEESSMPTIIVDDKNDMLDSNRVDSEENASSGAFRLFGSLATVFITLMLLQ